MTAKEKRELSHLLDLLCEHEEGLIECNTIDGALDRKDAFASRAVLRSHRVWRTAQRWMLRLEDGGDL